MTTKTKTTKPIIFSAPMIRSLLEGRKTQTRRVVKPRLGPQASWLKWEGNTWQANGLIGDIPIEWRSKILYPQYDVGDTLWVRETWAYFGGDEYLYQQDREAVMYRATADTDPRLWISCGSPIGDAKWRPSIFMPRWASRITLEVTEVRCERIQSITTEDIIAEGSRNLDAFRGLWEKLNGPRGYGWASSPWVWAYTFKRVTP